MSLRTEKNARIAALFTPGVTQILKYPNRKLYSLNDSCYITLSDIVEYARQERAFEIISHKDERDVTEEVLLQAVCAFGKLERASALNILKRFA